MLAHDLLWRAQSENEGLKDYLDRMSLLLQQTQSELSQVSVNIDALKVLALPIAGDNSCEQQLRA